MTGPKRHAFVWPNELAQLLTSWNSICLVYFAIRFNFCQKKIDSKSYNVLQQTTSPS
jgi:hypothetical protein